MSYAAIAYVVAFVALIVGPVLWLTWHGLVREEHSPGADTGAPPPTGD